MKENIEVTDINIGDMKNSIEEDIKDIEKYISFTSKRENFSHDTDWNWNKDLANKIEHILSDYKRILKENKEYYKQLDLDYTEKNFISKQRIKNKIDRLKQKAISYGPFIDKDESFSIESKISILQELLESEE